MNRGVYQYSDRLIFHLNESQQNRNIKIPAMGFSEYFIQNLSSPIETPTTTTKIAKLPTDRRLPDQEILDATEEIYFQENVNCGEYELKVMRSRFCSTLVFSYNGVTPFFHFRNSTAQH